MLNIHIICVGKLKESYLRDACAEYTKRLSGFCKMKITEISPAYLTENPNDTQIAAALAQEGETILSKISAGERVYAMCIEGRELTSPELAEEISRSAVSGSGSLVFIIGGSHGLADEVKRRADFRLSMSKMTFPHQLARVLLLEQIYRSFMISGGGKYHK